MYGNYPTLTINDYWNIARLKIYYQNTVKQLFILLQHTNLVFTWVLLSVHLL